MSKEQQIEEMASIIDKYGRGLVDYECRELAELKKKYKEGNNG